jgi:hypothetical protein
MCDLELILEPDTKYTSQNLEPGADSKTWKLDRVQDRKNSRYILET